MPIATIDWSGDVDGKARIVEQTRLPARLEFVDLEDMRSMWDAIRRLAVRGAPAIGIAGAFGVILGLKDVARGGAVPSTPAEWDAAIARIVADLATSRPTAVNLFWALDRMSRHAQTLRELPFATARAAMLAEALEVLAEDKRICRALGEHGAKLVPEGRALLTHCNAGGMATADYGTALAVMFRAHELGKRFSVFVDETRPLLQGARITAFELAAAGIDATLICDNMAGVVLRDRDVGAVFVGADRIAANGDTANKIGTYSVSVLAREHGVPFYVVAPRSTFDLSIADGTQIPIEERAAEEITEGFGRRTAPAGIKVFNPAFDVTPHRNITGIVTEYGVITSPNAARIAAFFAAHR
jgi:methylthioribose-1-phosphate isomerase